VSQPPPLNHHNSEVFHSTYHKDLYIIFQNPMAITTRSWDAHAVELSNFVLRLLCPKYVEVAAMRDGLKEE
jgi:hypothetical protein